MFVALEINQARKCVIVALEINWVNLLPVKSSISTERIVNLEGVPRSLEIKDVIIQLLLKEICTCVAELDVG